MRKEYLDWSNFDWKCFENICKIIAEEKFPGIEFGIHLGAGQNQDGLDVIGFDEDKGKFICIQSKRNNKFNSTLLKKAIKTFLAGEYLDNTYTFIVATSQDFQKRPIKKDIIDNNRVVLKRDYGVTFDCWDLRFIEEKLRTRFSLVKKYFGKSQAKSFCNEEVRYDDFLDITRPLNYVDRKLYQFQSNSGQDRYGWAFDKREKYDLLDLVINNSEPFRTFVIGDPHEGKSSYLKDVALRVGGASGQRDFQAIFLEVKSFNLKSIEAMLDDQCGDWQHIPQRDIILFIDGLDEVAADRFNDLVSEIRSFCNHNSSLSVICSCRKLFYLSSGLDKKFINFNVYELSPITEVEIDHYLKMRLGQDAVDFKERLSRGQIMGFMTHPFYLLQIVEDYMQTGSLPSTRFEVLRNLIDKSVELSASRNYMQGMTLGDFIVEFRAIIKKMALAFQLSGLNLMSENDVQQLFTHNERVLLRSNPLLSFSGDSWTFTNAMFQEHIAAMALSELGIQEVKEFATVGTDVVKIKRKWIQTLSSLITVLNSDSEYFQQVVALFAADNIELLFDTEIAKHSGDFKFKLLSELLERCTCENRRLLLIYEDKISTFIDDSIRCKQYVIDYLAEPTNPVIVKEVAARILQLCTLSKAQNDKLLLIVKKEIATTSEGYYAGQLVQTLAAHKMGDSDLVDQLVNDYGKLNEQHEYRDKVYELIMNLGLVDQFFTYGLNGVSVLVKYNIGVSHSFSERRLQNFFLAATNPFLLSGILERLNQASWIKYFGKNSFSQASQAFVKKLFSKLAEMFPVAPEIIIKVARYIKTIGKTYMSDKHPEVAEFLKRTGTNGLVSRLLIRDIFEDHDWQLGTIITPDIYDYVLFEFEDKNYSMELLRSCATGISYSKEYRDQGETFYSLCDDAVEGLLRKTSENDRYELYLKREAEKAKNDLKAIKSRDSFITSVKAYFKEHGSLVISEDELHDNFYIDTSDAKVKLWQTSTSNLVYNFLIHQPFKPVSLKQCLNALKDERKFEIFRVKEILNLPDDRFLSDPVYEKILTDFYYANLVTFEFENCERSRDDELYDTVGDLLKRVFLKLKPVTEQPYLFKMLLLDAEGVRGIESAGYNSRATIANIVLEMVGEQKKKLKQAVWSNMQLEISNRLVLGTHIELCRKLKITEARGFLYDKLNEEGFRDYWGAEVAEIYLELGGSEEDLLVILQGLPDYTVYYFEYLVLLLAKTFPKEIKVLLDNFFYTTTMKETHMTLVRLLCQSGSMDAFTYLVEKMQLMGKAPYNIQTGSTISALDTEKALANIFKVKHFILERNDNSSIPFYETAGGLILEWLYNLAEKSEEDMYKVIEFLKSCAVSMSQHKLSNHFNWYIKQILERFRDSDKSSKTIGEVKDIFRAIASV